MTTLTDPAREFADLCTELAVGSHAAGDEFLANAFGVKAWSAEFYQIIFCIIERADGLISIIENLGLDDDHRQEAINHVEQIKQAFGKGSLTNQWSINGYGKSLLSPANVQPLKMLSIAVRSQISYPRLNDDELAETLELVREFENWLNDHQLADQDFIRQALIDGIKQFKFRLVKVKWYGWGYTIDSLREVIAAYKLLEGATDPEVSPDAEAMLRKGSKFLAAVLKKIGVAQDIVGGTDFILRAYGAINLIQHGTSVTGLLTHMKG